MLFRPVVNWAELFWRDQVKIRQDQRFRCVIGSNIRLAVPDAETRTKIVTTNGSTYIAA